MSQHAWKIRVTDSSPASQLAAEEFIRLIKVMDPE